MLKSLYGLTETLHFGRGNGKQTEMGAISDDMERQQLKPLEGKAAAVTDAVVLLFSGSILFAGLLLLYNGEIAFSQVLIATVAMMSSFGPVVAPSDLSNDLNYSKTAENGCWPANEVNISDSKRQWTAV